MGKILDAFAEDELCVTPLAYKGSRKYREAVKNLCQTSEALETMLSAEEKSLFERFCIARDVESRLYQIDVFTRGFRIGVLMLFEVFAGGKNDFMRSKEADE